MQATYIEGVDSMDIKVILADGTKMELNKLGRVTKFEGTTRNFSLNTDGIWFEEQDCIIPWDEVFDYEYTDFHLTNDMYLDYGNVVDAERIVYLEIVGDNAWDTRED